MKSISFLKTEHNILLFDLVKLRFNPFAKELYARVDGWNVWLSTWNAPGYDTNLVVWEFSTFVNGQLQWAARVTLATGLTGVDSSANDHFADLFL